MQEMRGILRGPGFTYALKSGEIIDIAWQGPFSYTCYQSVHPILEFTLAYKWIIRLEVV